ncbi:MAG TPA: translesion DNA synthesis-associated protein ImuA [Methylococcaceae bacterium]|nr:translesion DNA synthesis-associated protein ImuA [Methylococcaceae bacterium]
MSMDTESLEQVLRSQPVWRGRRSQGKSWPVIATGFAELDALLPGGGWPLGSVMEIGLPCWGAGELRLLLPAMAALAQAGRWIAWVAPPYQPYAPGLIQAGIDLAYFLAVEAREGDIPWSLEKILRSGRCGMALAWPERLADHQARRLQLAAEEGGALAVLFPLQTGGARHAALRLALRPAGEGLRVEILKCRGSLHRASLLLNPEGSFGRPSRPLAGRKEDPLLAKEGWRVAPGWSNGVDGCSGVRK